MMVDKITHVRSGDMLSLRIQSTQQGATEHKAQPQMYSAAVLLCIVYRVTSGFTVTASHNLRKSARRCSGCTIMIAAPSLGDLPRKCEQKKVMT